MAAGQFLVQAGVADGDGGLAGQTFQQPQVFLVEGVRPVVNQHQRADEFVTRQER